LNDLLASIAPPGEKRDEKTAACHKFFADRGVSENNFQGVSACFDLTDYGAY
jgi:hypothetical protein